jgi:adenine phosphoribosyltransferase
VAFRRALDLMTVLCGDLPADTVVAIESRGFILGGALADRLGQASCPSESQASCRGGRVG